MTSVEAIAAALASNPRAFDWANHNDMGMVPVLDVQGVWIASNIANLAKQIMEKLP